MKYYKLFIGLKSYQEIAVTYQDRLLKVIPGGAHTYSRGFDQFPKNAPQILKRGYGAYVYDDKDNRFLDYGMALRAVNIGYANEQINEAAINQINFGNNLTRPSMIELEAAELMVDLIDSVDMVKFTKNGSTATTAAIKLSRAYTNRDIVLRCNEHPFFSYDDWFIGSTQITKGVLEKDIENTKLFNYNDIDSLKMMFDKYPNQIACVILEPSATEHPKDNFLHKVKDLCHKNGAVFILDEMITGFRWHLKGAQKYYNIEADLCTFGKAMANGFSVACVAGKKEIMSLGSIDKIGAERLFLLSTTHGAEMSGLGAFVESIKFIKENSVVEHIWNYGKDLTLMMNSVAKEFGVEKNFIVDGVECSPYYLTFDKDGQNSLELRTLFAQEMVKNGVLMPWIALSYSHTQKELDITRDALINTFEVYKKALNEGVDKYLDGEAIKPVFRKYN
jgi:glutamate-1-semialdehyde 2,1-aminomutase